MKIYLAGPLFSEEENKNLDYVETLLRSKGHTVFSPREYYYDEAEMGSHAWSLEVFRTDTQYIDWADCVVMMYYGNYSDSGTAWECGYAFGSHKPVVVVQLGNDSNLMVHIGCHTNITLEELETYDFDSMPKKIYHGKAF